MKIHDLKIKTRLLIGFSSILAMVLLLGGMATWHSWMIWKNTEYLYQHPFKVNIAIREIESNVISMQRGMKNLALEEDQESVNEVLHSINISESEVYRLFDTVYQQYLGERKTVDSAFYAFRDWKPIRDETIRLGQAGSHAMVLDRVRNVGNDHVKKIVGKVNILKEYAMKRAQDFYFSANKEKNQLIIRLGFLLLIIFLSSFVIIAFIMQGITIPLRELVNFAEQYSNGNYNARNGYRATNELGILAASMNRQAEVVHFELTVKNGARDLADTMLANDEKLPFCKSVLEALLIQTNSNLGAVYLLNEKNAAYEPYYSSGYIKENLKSFSAGSNEGELGAVLVGKQFLKLTRIPDDSVFVFSTIAGSIKPKEVILIPVVRRDSVVAIVSLASIEAYTPESLEIIRRSEKNLNMSFNAILAFDRIREYANSLDQQNARLNSQAQELQAQTSELIEQNTELELQKYQIDEANRLKSQFLSSMSHELRTPLNSVIALSGVLNKRLQDQIPAEEHSYLDIIERNAKNLLLLINDILDLSRIESGKIDIQYDSVSLPDIVNYILVSMQTQIREKKLLVSNLVGPETPQIISDSAKCHHILQNLISNAVKFTDAGTVEITAVATGKEVRLSVKDSGIGIPSDQLPFIFDEFRQVDGTTSRRYGGTGLGLAIVEKYSGKLDATIEVESEPGKGSTFTVVFPIEPASWKTRSAGLPGPGRKYHDAGEFTAVNQSEAAGKTILIVEDSEPAIVQLSGILKDQGYHVEVARNGDIAIEMVQAKIPDALILDLMMPGMDGFDVLEKIRGTQASAKIPVLILTAMFLAPSDLKRLTENNIHQLIQKGDIRKDELLEVIRQMLFPGTANIAGNKERQEGIRRITGPAKILIIDDNKDNGTTLKVMLDKKHTVIIDEDGLEVVSRISSVKPDLVFMDISLPGKDGFRIFDEIRNHPELSHIPIIAVTAKAMKGDRETILAHGFDDYISKPIDRETFDETIGRWLS